MATNDQLKALVKRHADGDDPQFYAVAMQVAAKRLSQSLKYAGDAPATRVRRRGLSSRGRVVG